MKVVLMKRSMIGTGLLAALAAGFVFVWAVGGAAQQASTPGKAVLVELFTSEGCSSCPPADRLLVELAESQPVAGVEIIALGEHVDYWDGLGWRDRFSSAEVTRRQQNYSRHFGENRVYTPQMVVDGAEEFIGSDKNQARQAIQRASGRAKARLRIEPDSAPGDPAARWTIYVDSLPPKAPRSVEVYVAVTENGLSNQVSRGENRGRLLKHTSVVRVLQKIGEFENSPGARFEHGVELPLDPSWDREELRVVVFAQQPNAGRVLGATSMALAAR